MKVYRRIANQISITFFFQVLTFFTGPLLLFILTRNLSTESYGAYSIFSSTTHFLSVFLSLGLYSYIITKFSGFSYKERAEETGSISLFLVFYFIVLFVVFLLIKHKFLSIFNLINYGSEYNIIIVLIIVGILRRILIGRLTSKKLLELTSILQFLRNSGWVYGLFLVMIFTTINLKIVLGMWLLMVILTTIIALPKINIRFCKRFPKKALLFGSPLMLYHIGYWLIRVADRYVLSYYLTLERVGIYSLGDSLVTALVMFSDVISGVIYPYYSESFNKKKKHKVFSNVAIKYTLLILLPAIAGLTVMGKAIITMVSGPRYLESASVIPWLALYPLLVGLSKVFYQNLMVRDKTKQAGMIFFSAGILNILLNMLMVPKIGIIGAAISINVSYLLIFCSTFYLSKGWKVDWRFVRPLRIMGATAIMSIVVYLIQPQRLLTKISTVIVGGLLYFVALLILDAISKEELKFFKELLTTIGKKYKIV